jgi:hypothetical protein
MLQLQVNLKLVHLSGVYEKLVHLSGVYEKLVHLKPQGVEYQYYPTISQSYISEVVLSI